MAQKTADPYVEAAIKAGLKYVTDYSPGIQRKRAGKGFYFVDARGKRIKDAKRIKRIRSLVVPPAWTEVWICPDPDGHIQVTARDAKGRKQYRYHPKYREVRDGTKFDRLLEFSEVLPKLRGRVEADMNTRGLPRRKVLATCVRLLERTLIRVGKPQYTKMNKSYGLTTLNDRHAKVNGSEIRFSFRGKSGVQRVVSLTDRRLAKIIQSCQAVRGPKLFQYLDGDAERQSVSAEDINEYLKEATGRQVTAKDFRTWAGTMFAAAALREIGPSTSERKAKRAIVQAVDQVAERLGNTRSVCRKYYIHPVILEAYMNGHVIPSDPPPTRRRTKEPEPALRRNEVTVLQFIHRELEK